MASSKIELENTLNSLMSQSLPKTEYEIIVVDDGSNKSVAYLADKYPVFLIRLEKNCGLSVVRNKGIQLAKGERIVFLDCDIPRDAQRGGAHPVGYSKARKRGHNPVSLEADPALAWVSSQSDEPTNT